MSININRYLIFLNPLLVAFSFILIIYYPHLIFYFTGIIIVVSILSLWSLAEFNFFAKTFWNFFPTPFLLLISSYLFFTMIDAQLVQYLFLFSVSLIYLLVLRNIFSFLHQTSEYQPYALENIFSYINMITIFLFFASFFGLLLFLNWPVWVFIFAAWLISGFLFMRTLWSYKINWAQSKLYILIVSIVMVESFLVMYYLPTSYIFNALIALVVYYLLSNLIKDFLRQSLDKVAIRKYLLISGMILLISFLTARWY